MAAHPTPTEVQIRQLQRDVATLGHLIMKTVGGRPSLIDVIARNEPADAILEERPDEAPERRVAA